MEAEVISREEAAVIINEILSEAEKIRNASENFRMLIEHANKDSNLYFLKVFSDMFGTDEKNSGISGQALHLKELTGKARDAL